MFLRCRLRFQQIETATTSPKTRCELTLAEPTLSPCGCQAPARPAVDQARRQLGPLRRHCTEALHQGGRVSHVNIRGAQRIRLNDNPPGFHLISHQHREHTIRLDRIVDVAVEAAAIRRMSLSEHALNSPATFARAALTLRE